MPAAGFRSLCFALRDLALKLLCFGEIFLEHNFETREILTTPVSGARASFVDTALEAHIQHSPSGRA